MVALGHNLTRFTRSFAIFSGRRYISTLRQRSIVSSFICTPPTATQSLKLALLKRSEKAAVYPSKWAACSGSIKPTDLSPEAAARREIKEETGLGNEDLELWKKGENYRLIDESEDVKTEWTIYPFAWRLKEGAREIKLNGENVEVRFVEIEELGNYDCVDKLEMGIEKVFGDSR